MFWLMLSGEYHKPKIENRIFIFIDINGSTYIAEASGHEKYFRMLRNFFSDITIPVLANDGEIYQYVGDEVLVSSESYILPEDFMFDFHQPHGYHVDKAGTIELKGQP